MSDERNMIEWTRPKLEEVRKLYAIAVAAKQESFSYDGHEFLTRLIEYLESMLPKE